MPGENVRSSAGVRPWWLEPVRGAAIGLVYFIVARVSLSFVVRPAGVAAVWLPSGLLLAALLCTARRAWFTILPCVGLANFAANLNSGNSAAVSLGFALANLLEGAFAASLLRRDAGTPFTLGRFRDVIGLTLVAATAANALTALGGAAVAAWGKQAPFWVAWRIWWVADGIGMLVIAPLFVTWTAAPFRVKDIRGRRVAEAALLFGMLLLAGLLAPLGIWAGYNLVFPLLLWAALRFDPRGAATAMFLVALLKMHPSWQVLSETGRFPLLGAQLHLGLMAGANLMLAAILKERREVEETLGRSEERYRTVVDAASDGIILQDRTGRILTWNRTAEAVFGISAGEAIGQTSVSRDWGLVREDGSEWPGSEHPSMRTLATGKPCHGITMGVRRPDGRLTWVSTSTNAMFPSGGPDPAAVVITFSDITEHKRMEDALRSSLAEQQVLLREVHHRVKNNLAAITGLLELQRQALADPGSAAALADLSRRIQSIALVHEKLYQADSLARVDFQDYLKVLISHLRASVGPRGELQWEISAPVELSLDVAVPCGMIVNELVTNAMKHAFPGQWPGAAIRVSLEPQGAGYLLAVEDNGVGLPPGADWQHGRTLGLRLVRMLGEHQLGGRLRIEGTHGTRAALHFGAPARLASHA